MKTAVSWILAVCCMGLLAGCDNEHAGSMGPLVTDPVSIEIGNATRANVQMNIGMGELKVSGGADKLMEGTLEYNERRWKPLVVTSHNGDHATVTVRQPEEHGGSFDHVKNSWDLRLANKVLLDLTVVCGAGQARLDLGDVQLRGLNVRIGVGQVDLDLTGRPKRDYEVTIHGGIGQAKVHLPEGVGIYATAHGGIGSINVTGLEKQGDHWQNDLYDKAKVNVRIEVNGGIGEIRLIG